MHAMCVAASTGLVTAPLPFIAPAPAVRFGSAPCADAARSDAWRDVEDWALLDSAPAFTVGTGAQTATFWESLAAATPELATRSARECEERWAELVRLASTQEGETATRVAAATAR